jgi:hypothetical protein
MLSAVYRAHNGQEQHQSVYGDYRQKHLQHWNSLGALTPSEGFSFSVCGSYHTKKSAGPKPTTLVAQACAKIALRCGGFPSHCWFPPNGTRSPGPPPVSGASLMRALMSNCCKQCNQPLVEIDHWGEHLTGCPKCNRWQASTGEWCWLAPDDIVALRAIREASGSRMAKS